MFDRATKLEAIRVAQESGVPAAAASAHCSENTIYIWLRKLQVKRVDRRTLPKPKAEEKRKKAVELAMRGITCLESGRILGISHERVRQYLRPLGILANKIKTKRLREERRSQALLLIEQGMTISEIADRLNCSRATLEKLVRGRVHDRIVRKWRSFIGREFGNLTILDVIFDGGTYFLYRCICGVERRTYVQNVIRGHTKSCGCRGRNQTN